MLLRILPAGKIFALFVFLNVKGDMNNHFPFLKAMRVKMNMDNRRTLRIQLIGQ